MTTRILIVENDIVVRHDLAEVLRTLDYLVEATSNGREALERLHARAFKPGLILLDLRTPELNGWDFVRALLAEPDLAKIPFVLVSGDPDLAAHATRLGAAGYLRKPFGVSALLEIVTRLAPPN